MKTPIRLADVFVEPDAYGEPTVWARRGDGPVIAVDEAGLVEVVTEAIAIRDALAADERPQRTPRTPAQEYLAAVVDAHAATMTDGAAVTAAVARSKGKLERTWPASADEAGD